MNRDGLLDMLQEVLAEHYRGLDEIMVVRVPEGVLILVGGGGHVLLRANEARLEVVS